VSKDDEVTLQKLRELLASGDPTPLTAHEMSRLRAMLSAYDMFLAGGKLGKMFIGALILLAAGIAAGIKLAEYLAMAGRAGQ
jgi:hypothetical protein